MVTFNSSWIPDESPETLFSERCWFQGAIINAISYGVTIPLFFLSFQQLVREKKHVEIKRRLPLLIYTPLIFLLATIYMITTAGFKQKAYIDDRNYPGGPDAFQKDMFSIPLDTVGCVLFVVSNWLSDGLLVWRFEVIYRECEVPTWALMLFPCLMLTGTFVLGILFLITNPFGASGKANNGSFAVPYMSLALALNIILTIAIVLRLLTKKCRIVSVLGPEYGTKYTSTAAIIIESAAIYSVVSLIFLILYGVKSPVSQAFIQFLSQFQTIAALLIVFRVSQGKAWTEGTAAHVMIVQGASSLEAGTSGFASPVMPDDLAHSAGEVKKNGEENNSKVSPSNNSHH